MMQGLTRNAGLKAISFVLATAIWFFVKGVTSDSRVVAGVPLEFRVKPDLTVLQTNASTVQVTVRGTREDVRQVLQQDLSAVIDLTHYETNGEIAVHLGPRSIRHSRRVQVTEINPSEIIVNLDRVVGLKRAGDSGAVELPDRSTVPVSRSRLGWLKARLNQKIGLAMS